MEGLADTAPAPLGLSNYDDDIFRVIHLGEVKIFRRGAPDDFQNLVLGHSQPRLVHLFRCFG